MSKQTITKPFYNSAIPSDWEVKTLVEVAAFINGKAYKQEELLSSGKYKVLRVGNFFTKGDWYYSDLELEEDKYVSEGDLMFAWSASFGPKYWSGEKTIYHYHIWKVIPSEFVTKDFLFFHLAFDTEKIFSSKQGGTMFHVTKGDMEKRKIILPPLPEQKAIAHILSLMDTAINKNNLLIAKKELQKKWLMQNLLTGKKRLKGFSGKWEEYKISQLGQIVTGNTPSMAKPEYYGDKYCWATAFDFNGVYIYKTEIKLSEEGKNLARIVPKGSILVTCIASIGKNAIAKVEMAFNQQINAIVPNQNFNSEFIYYKIENSMHKLREVAGAGAVSIINKSNFEAIKLEFPMIKEQTAIAQVLQASDKEIQLLKSKTEKLREKKKGLMQILLTGKKRLTIM